MRPLDATRMTTLLGLVLAAVACNEIDPVPTPGNLNDGRGGEATGSGGTGSDGAAGGAGAEFGGYVDLRQIVVSASRSRRGGLGVDGDGIILVAGLPGAILGEANRVVVRNAGTTATAEVQRQEDGSFAAVLPAGATDAILVFARLEAPNVRVDGEPVSLLVPSFDPNLSPAPPAEGLADADRAAVLGVTVVTAGEALVTAVAGAATPGTEAVVANPALSAVRVAVVGPDGSFGISITARSGDVLVFFTRRPGSGPGDPGSTSDAVSVVVP